VKLLFDENVSPALAQSLAGEYPGSEHVRDVGLRGAEDHRIWH
jgi:predicted nuclease of predicted toxin-antitoxin system